ncbi:MAG: vWA domain-containing protein [Candidatus Sericytochromatia bacterium]|nr:vWA domain-containing protein [Candidatus Sericytochromatia bacterium]
MATSRLLPLVALVASALLSGCTGSLATTVPLGARDVNAKDPGNLVGLDSGALISNKATVGRAGPAMSEAAAAPAMMAPSARASAAPMAAPAPMAPGATVSADMTMAPAKVPSQTAGSELRAGAVDDNAKFSDYLKFLKEFDWESADMKPRKRDVSQRKLVKVLDADGKPVHNADVTVIRPGSDWDGGSSNLSVLYAMRTHTDGRALFMPQPEDPIPKDGLYSLHVKAGENGAIATGTFKLAESDYTIKLPAPVQRVATGVPLDLAIVLDATSSMSGEIRRFQDTIVSIAERIRELPQKPKVRFSLVAYRDQQEAYVTKTTPFTEEIGSFQRALNDVVAAGGGDKPEDMEAALDASLNKLEWNRQAVRLAVLVADAAPHTDYKDAVPYTTSIVRAAQEGIKFFPIGASGLESEGEYAMRQIAQGTLGQYLFVTRGGDEASGGGGTASANVDKFREGRLDLILVDLVKAELAKLAE